MSKLAECIHQIEFTHKQNIYSWLQCRNYKTLGRKSWKIWIEQKYTFWNSHRGFWARIFFAATFSHDEKRILFWFIRSKALFCVQNQQREAFSENERGGCEWPSARSFGWSFERCRNKAIEKFKRIRKLIFKAKSNIYFFRALR